MSDVYAWKTLEEWMDGAYHLGYRDCWRGDPSILDMRHPNDEGQYLQLDGTYRE